MCACVFVSLPVPVLVSVSVSVSASVSVLTVSDQSIAPAAALFQALAFMYHVHECVIHECTIS